MKKILLSAVMFSAALILLVGCAEKTSSVTVLTKVPETSAPAKDAETSGIADVGDCDYVLNISSKKIHLPSCSSVGNMKTENIKRFSGEPKELIDDGYSFCRICVNKEK